MNNEILQKMVEKLSEEKFGRKFRHCAYFNKRLRTTGGRYLLKSHDIEKLIQNNMSIMEKMLL